MNKGPIERANEILAFDSWCLKANPETFAAYFVLNTEEEDRLTPEQNDRYLASKKRYMLARQTYQHYFERHNLPQHNQNYVNLRSLEDAAENFLTQALLYSEIKKQLGFQYGSFQEYYDEKVLEPQRDAARSFIF